MRHRKGFNHLGRTSAHRKAMLSNMASSLILHKRITTTTAKAKALRTYIEPLITRSKNDTTHSRRVVFSHLQNKIAVAELFREVSPKVMDRPGGYTRILKTGNRLGDNAEMCIIELVDYNENMLEDTAKKSKSTRRRRGSGKAKAEAAESGVAAKGAKKEEVTPETTAVAAGEEMKTEAETPEEEKVEATAETKTPGSEEAEGADREEAAAETESAAKEEVKAETESASKEEVTAEAESAKKEEVTKEGDNEPEAKEKSGDDKGDEKGDSTEDNKEDKKE